MLSTVEVPESLEKRYESNKQLGHKIAEALEGTGEEKTLTADVDLLAGDEPVYIYVCGSAYFKFYHGGRLLRMYSSSPRLSRCSSISALPVMPKIGLFIWWATPAASVPTLSILAECTRFAWLSLSSSSCSALCLASSTLRRWP